MRERKNRQAEIQALLADLRLSKKILQSGMLMVGVVGFTVLAASLAGVDWPADDEMSWSAPVEDYGNGDERFYQRRDSRVHGSI